MPGTDRRGKLRILACKSGQNFAEKVLAKILEKETRPGVEQKPIERLDVWVNCEEIRFANSELNFKIADSIRGADLYIFQDVENAVTGYSVEDNFRVLKTAVDAARRSGAVHITAVIPAFPYARQDKAVGREGITSAKVAQELENNGIQQVVTLDIHNTAIAGFFRTAVLENLHASKNIIDFIKSKPELFCLEKLVVMPTDLNGAKRAEHYALKLGREMVFVYKRRNHDVANTVENAVINGNIEGRDILLVDDMIDTAGTLTTVMQLAKKQGAKRVYAACSLPLLNGPAIQRLATAHKEGYLDAVIGTDAVYQGEKFKAQNPWFIEVSVASYFAKVIHRLNCFESISELLK